MASVVHALAGTTADRVPSGLGLATLPNVKRQPAGIGGSGGSVIDAFSLAFEQATPEQIGMHCVLSRAMAQTATVAVEYKLTSSGTWLQAHPLLRIDPTALEAGAPVAPVDAFAGSIFDLTPGASYDVRLTLTEAGQPTKTLTGSKTTRALPAVAGAPNKSATTASNLQAVFDGLVPGDVLQLADGTYTVSGLTLDVSGASGSPIYIRGESRTGVILKDTTGIVLQYLDASHIVLENLTIEGSRSDSGTAASSRGIEFWNGVSHTNLTVRNVDMVGVDIAFNVNGETIGTLIYNCRLHGNNLWTEANTGTPDVAGSPNLTWNDDGICMPGQGNCAWNNTLYGFGDSFAMKDGVENVACFFYRNKILMTGDDACEGDYAIRNCAFYDNYVTNAGTLLSLQPLWAGPFYCFRNIALNTTRGPYKLNATQSGFMIYNNTCVHADGTIGWGWNQANNGDLTNWCFVNNLTIYRDGTTNVLAMEATGQNPIDFEHNAWYPNGTFLWTNTGGSSANLAATSALPATTPVFGTATQRHVSDVICSANPFNEDLTVGVTHLVEVDSHVAPTIASGQTPKNAGRVLPGITDGYSGAAPDMGAIIEGRAVPEWGVVTTYPFALPSTVNTAKQIAQNSSRDLLPVSSHDVTSWDTTLFNAYGMGIDMPRLGRDGSYGFTCTGGHGDAVNIDLVHFDLEDGLFKLKPNGNAVPSRKDAYSTSDTGGAPFHSLSTASPATLPIPAHNYTTLVPVPRGPSGSAVFATRSSTGGESAISRGAHIQELEQRAWAHAASGGANGSGNYEGTAAYDSYSGRIYQMERYPGDYGDFLNFLEQDGAGSYAWNSINYTGFAPQPGDGVGTCMFLPTQNVLLYHRGGALQGIDCTSSSTIADGPVVLSFSGTSPASGSRWIWHPVNKKFYMKTGRTGDVLEVFDPGSDVMAGTGSFSQVTIGDAGLGDGSAFANRHYTGLAYWPKQNLLLWMVKDNDVRAVKV